MMTLRAALRQGGVLVATLYVGEGVSEGGVDGRTLEFWTKLLDRVGFALKATTDLTGSWRAWAVRLHSERLDLCRQVERAGPAVNGLAAISRRMLGLDGRPAFLQHVERYRVVASI